MFITIFQCDSASIEEIQIDDPTIVEVGMFRVLDGHPHGCYRSASEEILPTESGQIHGDLSVSIDRIYLSGMMMA